MIPSPGGAVARGLLVAAVALAASLPFARHASLVRDDGALLAPPVPGVRAAFAEDAWRGMAGSSGLYRPLARSLDSLVAGAGGGARAQKGASALLHAAASVAALGVAAAAGLSPPAALAAALLFAAHPAHGEVFGEVAGRAEILAALFSFLALLALRRRTALASALAILAALAAALSKESAVALPAIALLLPFPGPPGERLRRLALTALGVAAALALRALVLGSLRGLDPATVPLVDNPIAAAPLLEGRLFALAILARAAGLLVLPVRLSADWSYGSVAAPESFLDPLVLAGLAILVLGAAAAAAAVRSKRAAAFGAAAALAAYFPASQLVVPIGALFGERFLYFPSAFAAVAAAGAFERCRGRRAALAAVVTLFLVRGATHSGDFASNADLYRAADRARPGGARPPAVLAHESRLAGDRAGALAAVDRALAILPSYATAIALRATLLAETGRPAEAAAEFRRLALSGRGDFETWWNCALACRAAGDRAGAADAFREAMRADPRERERCERAIRALSE